MSVIRLATVNNVISKIEAIDFKEELTKGEKKEIIFVLVSIWFKNEKNKEYVIKNILDM